MNIKSDDQLWNTKIRLTATNNNGAVGSGASSLPQVLLKRKRTDYLARSHNTFTAQRHLTAKLHSSQPTPASKSLHREKTII